MYKRQLLRLARRDGLLALARGDRSRLAWLERVVEGLGTQPDVSLRAQGPALERLLTDIGRTLFPKVRCVVNLANRGAGLPDGGLFSADQFRRIARDGEAKGNPFLIQNPARGVIEAKPPIDLALAAEARGHVARHAQKQKLGIAERIGDGSGSALFGVMDNGNPAALSLMMAETADACALALAEMKWGQPQMAALQHVVVSRRPAGHQVARGQSLHCRAVQSCLEVLRGTAVLLCRSVRLCRAVRPCRADRLRLAVRQRRRGRTSELAGQ